MLANWRQAVRDALPPRVLHTYRLLRHTWLWPNEWEMAAAQQFLSPDKIAVDVGANVGMFTSVLARYSKSVVAFEPNPVCVRHLNAVMPRNCQLIIKAVSDQPGEAKLRVPVSHGMVMDALGSVETANHFDTETRATDIMTYTVETVTLDQVLLQPPYASERIAFVNIDAEGHEFAVLRGGEALLAAHRPVLLIELEYRHGSPVADIFSWLDAHNYIPRILAEGWSLVPIDPAGLARLQDSERLARCLAGDRHAGYVNNIFFLPRR